VICVASVLGLKGGNRYMKEELSERSVVDKKRTGKKGSSVFIHSGGERGTLAG